MKLDHSMIISIITVVMLVLNYIKKTDFPKELAIKNESFSAPDLSLGTTLAHPNPKSHKNQTLLKKMITLILNLKLIKLKSTLNKIILDYFK